MKDMQNNVAGEEEIQDSSFQSLGTQTPREWESYFQTSAIRSESDRIAHIRNNKNTIHVIQYDPAYVSNTLSTFREF
jgi:hypothetical protein